MLQVYTVNAPEFARYGRVVCGLEKVRKSILAALKTTPLPQGVGYVPEEPALQKLAAAEQIRLHLFGGMPTQLGWCNGHNTKLNCLEYHRDSEFNLGTENFILLLAHRNEIKDGVLDTAKVKAFLVPAGVLVEIFATTLHYAPCHTNADRGFRVLIALPKGTNTAKPALTPATPEDETLWACNKWLLAHADSAEATEGAKVALVGENIEVSKG